MTKTIRCYWQIKPSKCFDVLQFQYERATHVYNSQRTAVRRHADAEDVLEHRDEDLQACSRHEASDEGFGQIDGNEPELHEAEADLHTSMSHLDETVAHFSFKETDPCSSTCMMAVRQARVPDIPRRTSFIWSVSTTVAFRV